MEIPVEQFVTDARHAAEAIVGYVYMAGKPVPLHDLMKHLESAHPQWDQLTRSRGLVWALRAEAISPTNPAGDAYIPNPKTAATVG